MSSKELYVHALISHIEHRFAQTGEIAWATMDKIESLIFGTQDLITKVCGQLVEGCIITDRT